MLWGAALGALLCSSPALAQTSTVDELVVTAQKREESLQDIPAAVSAIGAEAIADRGLRTVQDLQYLTPSFQAGTGFNTTVIFLRGVGQSVGQPGVAMHVDGIYQPRSFQTALSQVDLARIEVLRGPQGTLYGRNATAGAVNFITNAPTDTFEGYVMGGYGSFDTAKLQGVVNMPISDRLRARVAVDYSNQGEGYIENIIPGGPDLGALETLQGRIRLQYDLNEDATIDLSLFGLKQEGVGEYLLLHNFPTAASIARNPYLANVIVPFEPWKTSANRESDREAEAYGGTLTLTWNVGENTVLKSLTSFARYNYDNTFDADGAQLDIFPTWNRLNSRTITQEFNLSSKSGPVDWLVGAYILDDKAQSYTRYQFPLGLALSVGGPRVIPNGNLNIVTAPYKITSYAAFADATWNVSDRFRVLVGGRYSEEEQDRVGWNIAGPVFVPAFGISIISAACTACFNQAKFHSFTPRLGVQYDLDEDKNLYFTISKGFKSGGINAPSLGPTATAFAPEKLLAYEGGFKSRLFDRSVTFNATAFYYDYTDFQLSQIIGLSGFITNASAASVKGLEFEGAWTPDEHWSLLGNLSLLDAKYDAFINTDGLAPELGVQNLEGKRLNYSPEASGNIGVQYRTDELSFGRLSARADLYMTSKIYFREFNLPLDAQDAYSRLDLNFIWDSVGEKFRARAYVNNATNEAYISTLATSDNFGARYINWAPPRTYGLELTAKF
jgi:iron complex outermembrane receptor protein